MTIRQWSVRRNEKIACHVTVRGEKAEDMVVVTGVEGGMGPRGRLRWRYFTWKSKENWECRLFRLGLEKNGYIYI